VRGQRQHRSERKAGEEEMMKLMSRFVSETEGQDLIEYALLAAIIALGVIAAMTGVRNALNNQYNSISTTIATGS
jgi:pilus assembly protein Flp/PilA